MFQSWLTTVSVLFVGPKTMSAVPLLAGWTLPAQLRSSLQAVVEPPPSQVKVAAGDAAAATSEMSASRTLSREFDPRHEQARLSHKAGAAGQCTAPSNLDQPVDDIDTEKPRYDLLLQRQIDRRAVSLGDFIRSP